MKISRKKRRVIQMEALQRVIGCQSRSIHQMTGEVFKLKALLEEAKNKACMYHNEVCRYKDETADLTVRCQEVEEMLRQEESQREIVERKCNQYVEDITHYKLKADILFEEVSVIRSKAKEYEKEIELLVQDKMNLGNDLKEQVETTNSYKIMHDQQKEMKNMYYRALNKCMAENNELKIELEELRSKKPLLKRVFG